MQDISKYTKNAQKYIKYGWAAWLVGENGDKLEFNHILKIRSRFEDENFTIEDFDSMIEFSSNCPLENQAWMRAKERYIAEHQQITSKSDEKKQKYQINA